VTPQDAAEVARAFAGDARVPDVWVFDRTSASWRELGVSGPHSDEDRARASKLRRPEAGQDLLARRATVRRVLALYLGREPGTVQTVTLPGGKPTYLPLEGDRLTLAYSSGYSGDLFCLAVGTASSLGVDVERERDVPRASGIAARWFTEPEAESLRLAAPQRRAAEFMRLWTAKEALAKRHAAGLRLMTRRGLSLSADELDVFWELAADKLRHFVPREGYVGTIASTETVEDVRVIHDPFLAASP